MCEYLTIFFYASEAQSKNNEKEKVREKEKVLERLEGMKRKIGQRGREKGIKRGKRKLKKQRYVENSAQPVGDRKGDFPSSFRFFQFGYSDSMFLFCLLFACCFLAFSLSVYFSWFLPVCTLTHKAWHMFSWQFLEPNSAFSDLSTHFCNPIFIKFRNFMFR